MRSPDAMAISLSDSEDAQQMLKPSSTKGKRATQKLQPYSLPLAPVESRARNIKHKSQALRIEETSSHVGSRSKMRKTGRQLQHSNTSFCHIMVLDIGQNQATGTARANTDQGRSGLQDSLALAKAEDYVDVILRGIKEYVQLTSISGGDNRNEAARLVHISIILVDGEWRKLFRGPSSIVPYAQDLLRDFSEFLQRIEIAAEERLSLRNVEDLYRNTIDLCESQEAAENGIFPKYNHTLATWLDIIRDCVKLPEWTTANKCLLSFFTPSSRFSNVLEGPFAPHNIDERMTHADFMMSVDALLDESVSAVFTEFHIFEDCSEETLPANPTRVELSEFSEALSVLPGCLVSINPSATARDLHAIYANWLIKHHNLSTVPRNWLQDNSHEVLFYLDRQEETIANNSRALSPSIASASRPSQVQSQFDFFDGDSEKDEEPEEDKTDTALVLRAILTPVIQTDPDELFLPLKYKALANDRAKLCQSGYDKGFHIVAAVRLSSVFQGWVYGYASHVEASKAGDLSLEEDQVNREQMQSLANTLHEKHLALVVRRQHPCILSTTISLTRTMLLLPSASADGSCNEGRFLLVPVASSEQMLLFPSPGVSKKAGVGEEVRDEVLGFPVKDFHPLLFDSGLHQALDRMQEQFIAKTASVSGFSGKKRL